MLFLLMRTTLQDRNAHTITTTTTTTTTTMSRVSRLCPLCKSNQVENETHFLFKCSKYSLQRNTLLNRIDEIIPDIERK